jgi:hypothetical protein
MGPRSLMARDRCGGGGEGELERRLVIGACGASLAIVSALERLLGLRMDLTAFYRFAARHRPLGKLAQRNQAIGTQWLREAVVLRAVRPE